MQLRLERCPSKGKGQEFICFAGVSLEQWYNLASIQCKIKLNLQP